MACCSARASSTRRDTSSCSRFAERGRAWCSGASSDAPNARRRMTVIQDARRIVLAPDIDRDRALGADEHGQALIVEVGERAQLAGDEERERVAFPRRAALLHVERPRD